MNSHASLADTCSYRATAQLPPVEVAVPALHGLWLAAAQPAASTDQLLLRPFSMCVPCAPNMLLHCRPSRQLLDANMPQVGIPCFVPLATRAPRHSYYFVMVNPFDPEPSSRHGHSKRGSMEILGRPPFPDLKLGPMISQTTFGSLFRGIWAGATVAVKVSICRGLCRPSRLVCFERPTVRSRLLSTACCSCKS